MMSRKNLILVLVLLVLIIFVYTSLEQKGEETGVNQTKTETPSGGMQPHSKESWSKYTPPNGSFEVLFPSTPQHVSEVAALPNDAKSVKYDIYLAQEKDGSTFMVSMIQYPSAFDAANQDAVLEGVMKEMVSGNPSNTLVKSDKSQFLNFPALDFAIQNSDFAVQSKAVLVDKTLYVLTVMDRDPKALDKDFQSFIGSFLLKNGEGASK